MANINIKGYREMAMKGEELLNAQAHIWNHIFNFINSMALKCAVQLRIPDAISHHGQPMTLPQLVSSLQVDPQKSQHIHRLMRILAYAGFFLIHEPSKEGDDQEVAYSLTNSSLLLLEHNPLTLSPFLLSMLDPVLVDPWQFISTWLRSDRDRTPFETAHGKQFWEHMGGKPKDGMVFNAAMASDARLVTSVLLGKYKSVFEGVELLVDVGGGTGTVGQAIAEAFPQMQCVVFDLPQVVADLKGSHNLMFVEGDMFQQIPPAGAILLKWILHDWSDEECVKILKRCKEAITSNGKKGKVMIIDLVVRDEDIKNDMLTETQLFWDVLMMVTVGGRERNEKEWAELFYKAGFGGYNIFPILGLRSLIEIYP
ncbi:probable O-methyltransferase 3 [Cucurbita pepo subsp. pepo]|uniref:probable O-methyltransferase 3 n=1 Tax=Cucurbita pepo subsp. pepo TaxID=3664 RepID=UPI000C9D42A9|nr:probable O-methyltransferase 3 [Cucurbita pepo subsp. pepo]